MLPVVVQGVEAGQRQPRDPAARYPAHAACKTEQGRWLVLLQERVSQQQLPVSC